MSQFTPQRKNVNKHTLHGTRLLEKSILTDGFIDAQTAAADGEIISGSARLELAADKFSDVEPIIVESDGTRPVIVVRTDIPNADDPRAKRLSVAANQIAKTDFNPDGELLLQWGNEDTQIKEMFSESEWTVLTFEHDDPASGFAEGSQFSSDFLIQIPITAEQYNDKDFIELVLNEIRAHGLNPATRKSGR